MKRFFTVTSPNNAVATASYAMMTFYGVAFTVGDPLGPIQALGDMWSTMLLISAAAATVAVLTSPRRRDPDRSLIIEFWSCITLCLLFVWLLLSLSTWRTETGAIAWNTGALSLIFVISFAARIFQIRNDRKALRVYRASR